MTQGNRSDEGSSDSGERSEDHDDYAAFRTITHFIHIIQRWPDLRRSNIQERDPTIWALDRLVLKLCNSFAVLSVIRREVVAVGVGVHLDSAREPPVDLILTQKSFQKFDILFNENPREGHFTALNELNGNDIREPNPPDALKAVIEENRTGDNLKEENRTGDNLKEENPTGHDLKGYLQKLTGYLQKLKVTRQVRLVPMVTIVLMLEPETILPWKSIFGCYRQFSILLKQERPSNTLLCTI
jgi:hypothetical protein